MPTTVASLRVQFFGYLFGETKGYLCIAAASPPERKDFKQHFFEWPRQRDDAAAFIERLSHGKDVWFGTSLFDTPKRAKETALPGSVVWADLDLVEPDQIDPAPNAVLRTSTGRYQAFWRLPEPVPPDVQEDYARKVTYHVGADKGGWGLTKLLRVPFTYNYKYEKPVEVELLQALEEHTPVTAFESLPEPVATTNGSRPGTSVEGMPDPLKLPSASEVIYKYSDSLKKVQAFRDLFAIEPSEDADWSKMLWRLINICLESGLDSEETFVVALEAKCNKYARDNRPISYLWRDVLKAEKAHSQLTIFHDNPEPLIMPTLVDAELVDLTEYEFFDTYIKWGEATDASPEYHEVCCSILLSAILSEGLKLSVSWGTLVPNLWALILGESTLTRKTTAMSMAMEIVNEVDEDILLSTDGSVEGLLTGLSVRPRRTSIFYKDEVAGFFDSINRKDYLAGMPETLTQLYDVPQSLRRLLRKEVITINSPYFIFFCGGIRDRVYSLLSEEYVLSGFLPRFLVVSGEADLSRLRLTGPPTEETEANKQAVANLAKGLNELYCKREAVVTIGTQQTTMRSRSDVHLTLEAWELARKIEDTLIREAQKSHLSMLALPTFTRLYFSLLKVAMLLAASRQEPDDANRITVEKHDVEAAASLIQKWGRHSIELLSSTGKTVVEHLLDRIKIAVYRKPGVTKSYLMQRHHLLAREANEILNTLQDRGLVDLRKEGRGLTVWPAQYSV